MEEGGFHYRERNVVEEGSEVAGEEVIIDYSDDEHQVFDEMSVRVRHFYFVKVLPLENPTIDAMIKKAEETIDKTNRDQVVIAPKIRERMMDRDAVRSKLSWMNNYSNYELTLKWHRERLDILHLSLDKLTFANNAYKGKPVKSCLSVGEVDKQKLSFLMAHGCKNMADERKLLREVNASQGKDGGMTLDELHAPIQRLRQQMSINYVGHTKIDEDDRKQAILKDINQHEIIRERAIATAVVNGKLWNSLSSKKSIQEEVLNIRSYGLKERQRGVNTETRKVNKELEMVEKDIRSLQKLFADANRKKDAAYNTILNLKKQYGEENASYYQYRSVMKKVEVLAKKKDIAALQELSQIQAEKFMQQWNNNLDFRNGYKKRVIPSLNNRHLGVDGRMITNQKPEIEVEDTRKVIKPEALSKTRLKWMMKDPEDPSELLS